MFKNWILFLALMTTVTLSSSTSIQPLNLAEREEIAQNSLLVMKNSSFESCKVKECHFTSMNLPGTLFHACDLTKADFSTARSYSINPQSNQLKKARFSLPEVISLLRYLDIIIQ